MMQPVGRLVTIRARSAPLAVAALFAAAMAFAQGPTPYRRGDLVKVPEVTRPAILKIVGLPDEIVEANERGVFIDDVAVTGFSQEFLTRQRWARQYIPMDHYFVMGEERAGDEMSGHVGIYPADALERTE
jgi:hypothetical protein